MRTFLGIILFIIVQVLFIPLAVIGSILVYYKQVFVSKKLGVSATAVEVINGRWTMDKFGLRKDTPTVKLFNALPNTTSLGLWLALFPLYLLKLISGKNIFYPTFKKAENATIANLVTTRTVYFDKLLIKSLKNSEQFVVMGAGLDTRCYGELMHSGLTLFELDQKQTQDFKKDHLHKTTINTSKVTFVAIDFSRENWFEKLKSAGFDPNKVTTFLWEGVTLYLSEEDIKSTLNEISTNVAKGSALIADFYSDKFVSGELMPGKKTNRKTLELTGESLGYGVTMNGKHSEELNALIEAEHLKIGEVYYLGSETKKGTWMAVSEILV